MSRVVALFPLFSFLKRFQDGFRAWGMTNGTCENELPAKTHGTSLTQTPDHYNFKKYLSIIFFFGGHCAAGDLFAWLKQVWEQLILAKNSCDCPAGADSSVPTKDKSELELL